MRLLVAAVLVLMPQEEPTLKPLCEVAKRLDEGIKAFMDGKDMQESFKNWDVGGTPEAVATKLREDLAKDHVALAKTFGIDLRLHLFSEGKMVYEVQAILHATSKEAGLLVFRGKASESSGKSSLSPDKLSKEAKPFGDAALALLKILKTKKADELPFADEEKMSKLFPANFSAELKKSREESRAGADALKKDLNDLKYDEVRVGLNEHFFSAIGEDGSSRNGWINGKLKLTPEGKVTFRLSRYETK